MSYHYHKLSVAARHKDGSIMLRFYIGRFRFGKRIFPAAAWPAHPRDQYRFMVLLTTGCEQPYSNRWPDAACRSVRALWLREGLPPNAPDPSPRRVNFTRW